ncbi:flavohemoglobin expression-modulating QEGLA motif protein [Limibacter armeniacum]|uniref:flavohemoglobin expression-modulating QEGLA motif protein n=1 Tax=Limibacter armeniacum TaxID=466084 RepID=UPI002FE5DC53
MQKLTAAQIIEKIQRRQCFEAETADNSLYIKIEDYTPFAGIALHNGNQLREELQEKCALTEEERWYEEAPYSLDMISSLPIVLAGNDSRFEYDLNRPESKAVYKTAWNKEVWNKNLTKKEKDLSLEKHRTFYQILDTLIQVLENKFSAVLVFDIHAFNHKRIDHPTPTFNVGTELLDDTHYRKDINFFLKELKRIKLPSIDVSAAENEVFFGNGYLLEHLSEKFAKTLVFSTDVKKVYCNEETGEVYPVVVDKLTNQLKKAIINTAAFFARNRTNLTVVKKNHLLSFEVDDNLLKVDKMLMEIAKGFEILSMVNPINIEQAKKEFFKSRFQVNPTFKYRQLTLNPFEVKRQLYAIPVEDISDISLKLLYQDIIDSYADKIDMIASIGTDKFLYNSLRYFGEPDYKDVRNADYLLHCSPSIDGDEEENLSPVEVKEFFKEVMDAYGFKAKVEISKQIVSKVLIINKQKSVKIRKDAMFSEKSLYALAEHEIGVHMVTTVNARLQPLSIFRLGMPHNTHTQEGLAILSELLSNNITVSRLKMLALRVKAIDLFLKGNDFKAVFHYLADSKHLDQQQAFYLAARIFRGGGFTKDYLYLRGFRDILKHYKEGNDLSPLLIGKTTLRYQNIINEMIERKICVPPKYITRSFESPIDSNPVINYVMEGLQ